MPYGGKFGVVDLMSTVRNWSINDAHDPKPYVASNTSFGQGAKPGVESWDGSFEHYGHTPVVFPGQLFAFIGFIGPTNGVSGTGPRYYGNAYVEQTVINWNWAGGDILNTQVNFKGHLALSYAAAGAALTDVSSPTVPMAPCTRIDYSIDGNTWTEWEQLVSAALTLSCALQSYTNSSTVDDSGARCRLWTGQVPGPVSWTLAVTDQGISRALFEKGDDIQLRLYVTDTLYWQLKWAHVKDFTGIQVNVESGAIVQQTVNFMMNGFNGGTGYVRTPSGVLWWPFGSGTA